MKNTIYSLFYLYAFLQIFFLAGCSAPLQWPEFPLYPIPQDITPQSIVTKEQFMEKVTGKYSHYDVVSYEDNSTKTPMKTFVVSYGITEFFVRDGELYQKDSFCRASHIINQRGVESSFSDKSAQAIEPRIQKVDVQFRDGSWHIYRPPTPTLLGIEGDPEAPLSTDPDDPRIIDPDGDGKPGVTVQIRLFSLLKGELYITRREIFSNYLTLYSDGSLRGYVEDRSEQFVLGASWKILEQPSRSEQVSDRGLNPLILKPLPGAVRDCSGLLDGAADIFPDEPAFVKGRSKR